MSEAKVAENYLYWQEHGDKWPEIYAFRKQHQIMYHNQEIFLANYLAHYGPARVLEFGCGFGRHLRNLSAIPGIEPYGYDQSPTMLAGAGQWAQPEWVQEHLTLGEPVTTLPYPDKYFDIVYTSEVLIHVRPEDVPAILRELLRIARRQVFHLETTPGYQVAATAHDGCWYHDLVSIYKDMGYACEVLSQAYLAQTPYRVILDASQPVYTPPPVLATLLQQLENDVQPVLDQYQQSADELISENRKLKRTLQEIQSQHQTLKDAHTGLQTRHQTLKNTLQETQSQHQTLKDAHNDLQTRHQTLKNTLQETQTRYQAIKDMYNDLQTQHQTFRDAHKDLHTQHQTLKNTLQETQVQHQTLRDAYNDLQARHQTLKDAHKDQQTQYQTLKHMFEDKQTDKQSLRTMLTESRAEIQALKLTLHQNQLLINNQKAELFRLQNLLEQQQRSTRVLHTERRAWIEALESLRKHVETQDAFLARLKLALDS